LDPDPAIELQIDKKTSKFVKLIKINHFFYKNR